MSIDSINWWDKLADWSWTLVLAAAAGVIGVVARVFKHESRLQALEKSHDAGVQKLRDIEAKMDENQDKVLDSIDRLRNEIAEDYRLVLSKLLERVPRP